MPRDIFPCYTSTARTATPAVMKDQSNRWKAKGLLVNIHTSAIGAAPSTVFHIDWYDPISNQYYTILSSVAIVGTGSVQLRIHPDLTAAANLIAKEPLPMTWRVRPVHGNANSHTYSVSASPLF